MKWKLCTVFSSLVFLTCLQIETISSKEGNNINVNISRKHIVLWFDYSVRYFDHEALNAYSKAELRAMVNVVSSRFSKLAIDIAPTQDQLPPTNLTHSRLLIPEVVAERNKDQASQKSPMEVMVSYDVAKIARTKEITSFDVAKYMADKANEIFPGTVKTLLMYTGFSIMSYYNSRDTIQQLQVAREKIKANDSHFNYDLAVFLDLKDCGHFKGSLGQKAKDHLPYVETMVVLLRPSYHQMTFNADTLHKMFVAKFEDCERKLKEEKSEIRVVPSVLWLSKKGGVQGLAQCWQLMSDWAKTNDKEVIIFEAFDTPHGHLISDQGWWKLRDKAQHDITEESFLEKISEKDSKKERSGGWPSGWDEDSDEGESDNGQSRHSLSVTMEANANTGNGSSGGGGAGTLYILLILLSVICLLLAAVVFGLVYGFHKMLKGNSFPPGGNPRRQRYHLTEENEEDNNSDSVLEIRDRAPIVAVTYKK